MGRRDWSEWARLRDLSAAEQEEMRLHDLEEAQAEMRRFSSELDVLGHGSTDGVYLRSPEARKLMEKLQAATDRAARSRNMNAWRHWKGLR